MTPILANHYTPRAAYRQKVEALITRSVTQARDVFDLYLLTAPFPAHISLHTALYHHGIVSQMPAAVYCMSPARSRVYDTPLGRSISFPESPPSSVERWLRIDYAICLRNPLIERGMDS